MKKIIGLFAILLILNGCDDGNLTIETINFEDITAVKCTNSDVVYKIKENEALILEIPASSFINEPTAAGITRNVIINETNKVTYRSYAGTIATANICDLVQPSTPDIIEEWKAISGTIEITTTANVVPNTTSTAGNATKITGYTHNIIFKGITFDKPGVDQLYENYPFGNYVKNITPLPFSFDEDADKCTSSNIVYNFSGSESLVLDIPPSFFPATSGTQTGLVSATNKVTYKFYESALNSSYFCTSPTPTTPVLKEQWNANFGVTGVSGIIEVTTTTFGTGFKHTIRLKKVTLKKGLSEFYLGDDYLYGSFIN